MMPPLGSSAPAFTLADQEGTLRSLKDYAGGMVVLYFYPRDNTPGCTTEACNFRDAYAKIRALGATVVGISPDSVESHSQFASTYALPITLLADPSRETIKKYGAWGKKTMYGKEYDGVLRCTMLIDAKGKIAKVYEKVSTEEHADEVLNDLRALSA